MDFSTGDAGRSGIDAKVIVSICSNVYGSFGLPDIVKRDDFRFFRDFLFLKHNINKGCHTGIVSMMSNLYFNIIGLIVVVGVFFVV